MRITGILHQSENGILLDTLESFSFGDQDIESDLITMYVSFDSGRRFLGFTSPAVSKNLLVDLIPNFSRRDR